MTNVRMLEETMEQQWRITIKAHETHYSDIARERWLVQNIPT